jgi:hypothetical protein
MKNNHIINLKFYREWKIATGKIVTELVIKKIQLEEGVISLGYSYGNECILILRF